MSSESGPKFVTDGLILCLDAANPRSYISGATIWNDLTYNISGGTLTNGPTFSSSNGGSIVFDGIDDYVIMSSGVIPGNESFTVTCFLKYSIPGGSTFRDIMNNRNISTAFSGFLLTTDFNSSNGKIRVQLNNTTTVSSFTTTGTKNIADNKWNQVVIVVNRVTNLMTFFVNGIQDGNSLDISSIGDISAGSNLQIGGDLAFNSTQAWFPGNIASVQIYNRALALNEVQQNYNATKSRFGL